MTVPGYVDSEHLVWRHGWFDSTSAAARTFNVGQWVVMVRDTSSLNPETATIHCLVTLRVHLQCRGERLSLNLGAQRPLQGALSSMGRVLVDVAKRPKPESSDRPAYFAILTLLGS